MMLFMVILCGYAVAEINAFNRWLYHNGHYDLVEKVENENMILYKNKYEIYTYPERYWIPEENAKPKPNYITLLHEFYKYSEWTKPKLNKISIKKEHISSMLSYFF